MKVACKGHHREEQIQEGKHKKAKAKINQGHHIQYAWGKKRNHIRGHKLTQSKVQKNKNKKKDQEKVPTLAKNILLVPKNNKKFRKTRSRVGQETPEKEVGPIAPNSEAESQTFKIYHIGVPIQVKN